MCGIMGYTGQREAAPILLSGIKKLEYRGYDSAGLAVVDQKGCLSFCKTVGKVSMLWDKTDGGKRLSGSVGIAHTRWATHGEVSEWNAHPHFSADGALAIVHNGVIENYAVLREELEEKGCRFVSETDTEVIVQLIGRYRAQGAERALIAASERLTGSYAFALLMRDMPGTVYLAKKGSPLLIGIGKGEIYFASDAAALVAYTEDVIYLADGEFAKITPEGVRVFDRNGRTQKKSTVKAPYREEDVGKGAFPHYMLKEIFEQPRAVQATLAQYVQSHATADLLPLSDLRIQDFQRIVIVACGSAFYAGLAARSVLEALCRLPVSVELAGEFRYSEPIVDAKTLVVAISQSGETADTIAALAEGKARGAYTVAIVNVKESALARLADHTLYTAAGPEIAVATTKGYTTQLCVLYLLSLFLGQKRGLVDAGASERLLTALEEIPNGMQRALALGEEMKALAHRYFGKSTIFFIGRLSEYALALEGALKLKEISYLHAEGYAAGELKHGSIALVERGTPMIALCCQEKIRDKLLLGMLEAKARGAEVIALCLEGKSLPEESADTVVALPRVHELFLPLCEVIPLQLFAYYVAKERGCDIDQPKNLAKSVTVE